jgi:hypothetical protein
MTTQPISAAQYRHLAVVLGVAEEDHALAWAWAEIPASVRTAKMRGTQEQLAAKFGYTGPLPADLPEPRRVDGAEQAVYEAVEPCRDCGRGQSIRQGERDRVAKYEAKRGRAVYDAKSAAGGSDE